MPLAASESASPTSSYYSTASDIIGVRSPFDHFAAELLNGVFRNLNFWEAVVASHVCATWRQVVISDPLVWRSLDLFGWRASGDALAEILTRARGLPVELLHLQVTREQSTSIASVLWEHMHHTVSLDLELGDPGVWQLLEPGLEVAAPMLRTLSLKQIYRLGRRASLSWEPPILAQTIFAGIAPNLRNLRLIGVNLPPTYCPAFTTVVSLNHDPPPHAHLAAMQNAWVNLSDLFPCLAFLTLQYNHRSNLVGNAWSSNFNHSLRGITINLERSARDSPTVDLRSILSAFWHADVQHITLGRALCCDDGTVRLLIEPGSARRVTHMDLASCYKSPPSAGSHPIRASMTIDCGLDYPMQRDFNLLPSAAHRLIGGNCSTLVTLRCQMRFFGSVRDAVFLELTMLALDLSDQADLADESEYFMRSRLSATNAPKLRCLSFCARGTLLKQLRDGKNPSARLPSLPAGPLLDVLEKRWRAGSRTLREIVLESVRLALGSDTDRADANRLARKVRVICREPTPPGSGRRPRERMLVAPLESPLEHGNNGEFA